MKVSQQSLRGKLTLAYLAGVVLMMMLATVNWRNLSHLQKIVAAGENASRLFDTTLEARRYEKNFFLYHQQDDYVELLRYSRDAARTIDEHRGALSVFTAPGILEDLERELDNYLSLLREEEHLPSRRRDAWEKSVRSSGQKIVGIAEGLSRNEHRIMDSTLRASSTLLLISVIVAGAAGLALSVLLVRLFIRPLGLIEKHMDRIAEGDLSLIPFRSQDRELVSVNRAFHRMLSEIDARQQHIIQSEKLASFGTLLFGVAHELNNPLSNIMTSSQILAEELEEADPAYKRELLAQIDQETERAKEIVRSILDYSRKREKERVQLIQLVYEAIRFIRGDLPAKVEIAVRMPAEGLSVLVDRQGMQQAFLNLIKNALESMPGEGQVTISGGPTPDGKAQITIHDTGAGIPLEVRGKIFDPFFTTKEGKKGSGLGLFIVHKIVTENGGTISVHSEPGRGTVFTILLPLKEAGHD